MRSPKFIGILGSGAREHAIAWKLNKDLEGQDIEFGFYPGNAYLKTWGTCYQDFESMMTAAASPKFSDRLILTGSEAYAGLSDSWRRKTGWIIWGPTLEAAQLEWSKDYSKQWMKAQHIPTAECYGVANSIEEIESISKKIKAPFVVKYDGLVGGKGVAIVETPKAAQQFYIKVAKLAGDAFTKKFILEEKLTGVERSLFLFVDTKGNVQPGPLSMDFKLKYDNDIGPNTGGMGAFTPAPGDPDLASLVASISAGLKKSGLMYSGVLYVGIMMTQQGPKVLEFNVRLGDPEAQTFLPALTTSFYDVIIQSNAGELTEPLLAKSRTVWGGIVCATQDYAETPTKQKDPIGSDWFEGAPYQIFFSGSLGEQSGQFEARSGRIATLVYSFDQNAPESVLLETEGKAIEWVEKHGWKHIYLRKDLAKNYLIQKKEFT
jgi:phosphoribosylamine---glycine ligase